MNVLHGSTSIKEKHLVTALRQTSVVNLKGSLNPGGNPIIPARSEVAFAISSSAF